MARDFTIVVIKMLSQKEVCFELPPSLSIAVWIGHHCLCRGRTWTRAFFQGGRGNDGQVQTKTRELNNLDPFQSDILYIFVQNVETPKALHEKVGEHQLLVSTIQLWPQISNSHPVKQNPYG